MVSEYTVEKREQIMARARELLATPPAAYTPQEEPLRYRRYDPPLKREPEPRRREPRRPTDAMAKRMADASAAPHEPDWSQWEAWLQTRLETERETTLGAVVEIVAQALGDVVGDAIEQERDQAQRDLRELRAEAAKLASTVDELFRLLNAERGKVIDLPALPLRRVTN
jgi:hypothetical protein